MSASNPPTHLPDPERDVWLELASRWPDRLPLPAGPDFEAWLGQAARLRAAQRQLATDGLIVTSPKGDPIPHPALDIERRAQTELRAWGDRFDPDRAKRRAGL